MPLPTSTLEPPAILKEKIIREEKEKNDFETRAFQDLKEASICLQKWKHERHDKQQSICQNSKISGKIDTSSPISTHLHRRDIPGLVNKICLEAIANQKRNMTPNVMKSLLSLILQFVESCGLHEELSNTKNNAQVGQHDSNDDKNETRLANFSTKNRENQNNNENSKSNTKVDENTSKFNKRAKLWAIDRISDLLSPPFTSRSIDKYNMFHEDPFDLLKTPSLIKRDENNSKTTMKGSTIINMNADIPELDAILSATGPHNTIKHEKCVQEMLFRSMEESMSRVQQCLEIWRINNVDSLAKTDENRKRTESICIYETDIEMIFSIIKQQIDNMAYYKTDKKYPDVKTKIMSEVGNGVNLKRKASTNSIESNPKNDEFCLYLWETDEIALHKLLRYSPSLSAIRNRSLIGIQTGVPEDIHKVLEINDHAIPSPHAWIASSKKRLKSNEDTSLNPCDISSKDQNISTGENNQDENVRICSQGQNISKPSKNLTELIDKNPYLDQINQFLHRNSFKN